jgi:DNA-binding transcriptional regulator YhcF (GntR family)
MGMVELANQAMQKALAIYEAFEELADDGTIQAVKEEALAVYGHGKLIYAEMTETADEVIQEAKEAADHLTVIFAIAQQALEKLMSPTRAMPKALDAMTTLDDLAVGVAAEIER